MVAVVQDDVRTQLELRGDHVGRQAQGLGVVRQRVHEPTEVRLLFGASLLVPQLTYAPEGRLAQRGPDAVTQRIAELRDRNVQYTADEVRALARIVSPAAEVRRDPVVVVPRTVPVRRGVVRPVERQAGMFLA